MSAKGTYVLILYVKKGAALQIGKLGCFEHKPSPEMLARVLADAAPLKVDGS